MSDHSPRRKGNDFKRRPEAYSNDYAFFRGKNTPRFFCVTGGHDRTVQQACGKRRGHHLPTSGAVTAGGVPQEQAARMIWLDDGEPATGRSHPQPGCESRKYVSVWDDETLPIPTGVDATGPICRMMENAMTRIAAFRMNRYWAASLPLPAYFGVITALYGFLTWAFDAFGDHRHATWGNLVLHVVIGSLFGAVMTALVAFRRRRSGGSALQIATAKAVRVGAAPAGADPVTWTPVIERRLRTLERSRWSSPLLLAPIVVFAVVGWALAPAAALPALWLIVISVVLVAVSEVQAARYVPRARTVLNELQSPEARRGVSVAPTVLSDGTRPKTVLAALIASAVGACAVATNLAIFLFTPGNVLSAARKVSADGHTSLARAEQLASIAVAVVTTYWSVLLLALVVFGWFAFTGRNWARAWLVPTALLAIIELIAHKPLSLAIPIAAIAAVVLLYLPPSNAFFAARRDARSRN